MTMTPDDKDEFDRVNGLASMHLYDYLDTHGDMLSLDIVDEEKLVVSVQRRGQTGALNVIIDEPEDARKMAGHMTEWADAIEEARE